MHRHIFNKLLELVRASYEICFAVNLYEHADFAAHVYVRADRSFGGDAPLFFARGRKATLS